LLASPDSSSTTHHADDLVVKYHKEKPTEEDILRFASVKVSNIHLIDLAIAAKVVHQKCTYYRALETQCYWYADMLFSVLEKRSILRGN
jgi:hypothetical protein